MPSDLLLFLIDDDDDDQEIFSMVVEELDSSVKCMFAKDGVNALEKLEADYSFIPHLIFIDMNMPRMNGIECLGEIKKISRLNHIPAYMYSTSAEPRIVDECLRVGAAGFIRKEVNPADLQKNLLEIISELNNRKS